MSGLERDLCVMTLPFRDKFGLIWPSLVLENWRLACGQAVLLQVETLTHQVSKSFAVGEWQSAAAASVSCSKIVLATPWADHLQVTSEWQNPVEGQHQGKTIINGLMKNWWATLTRFAHSHPVLNKWLRPSYLCLPQNIVNMIPTRGMIGRTSEHESTKATKTRIGNCCSA